MRLVSPIWFISEAARMKNGTASRGMERTLSSMLRTMVSAGRPISRSPARAPKPMAAQIGTRNAASTRNTASIHSETMAPTPQPAAATEDRGRGRSGKARARRRRMHSVTTMSAVPTVRGM